MLIDFYCQRLLIMCVLIPVKAAESIGILWQMFIDKASQIKLA